MLKYYDHNINNMICFVTYFLLSNEYLTKVVYYTKRFRKYSFW